MSDSSDYEQAPVITEKKEPEPEPKLEPEPEPEKETMPIMEETALALPPPPTEEEEWGPIPEQPNMDASPFPTYLYGTVPVILGVFSLLLLILCGFFGYQYFQSVQISESKVMKTLNQWMISFQSIGGEFHKTHEAHDENKETLKSLQNQNEYLIQAVHDLRTKQEGCGFLGNWEQHGNLCYFPTTDMVPWSNCSDLCVSLNATFLKTGRKNFMIIMNLIVVNNTWLGITYKEEFSEWRWEDDSILVDLHSPRPNGDSYGNCVFAKGHVLFADSCNKPFSCMCEKSVNSEF